MQSLAFIGAVGDDGLRVVAVADLPAFADAFTYRQCFPETGEDLVTPDPLDEDRAEFVRVKHLCALQLRAVLLRLHGRKEELQTFSMGKQSDHSHGREIWAVILVGLSLLLLLSLISYDKYDLGDVAASGTHALKNFIGPNLAT